MKKIFLLLQLLFCTAITNMYPTIIDVPYLVLPRGMGNLENLQRAQQVQALRNLEGLDVSRLANLFVNDPLAQGIMADILTGRPVSPLFVTHVLAARVRNSDFSHIAQLVRAGADLNAPILVFKSVPLHHAAHKNNVQAIRDLLAHGANINAQDRSGQTPLHVAILGRNIEAIQALLQAGARSDIPNKRGQTAQDFMQQENIFLPKEPGTPSANTSNSGSRSCIIS